MYKKKKFETRFINALMKEGKYLKAEKIYYTILNKLKTDGIKKPYSFLRKAFINMTPVMGVVVKKRGAREFYFPKYLDQRLGDKYAIKWLIKKIGQEKSDQLILKIQKELIKAYKNQGDIVKEKWELYKSVRFAVSLYKKKSKKSMFQNLLKKRKRRKWL